MATSAPSAAARSAMRRPIPRPAPVTSSTWLSSRIPPPRSGGSRSAEPSCRCRGAPGTLRGSAEADPPQRERQSVVLEADVTALRPVLQLLAQVHLVDHL